jgi:hypothetical protein
MAKPRPPDIVFSLAKTLHELLRRALREQPYCEDRIAMGLLAILSSRRFREALLFRDFSRYPDDLWLDSAPGRARPIYLPAQVYLTLVLCRRLTLANNLLAKPTNMHLLLKVLANHGAAVEGWPLAEVRRAPREDSTAIQSLPGSCSAVARVLEDLVRGLGEGYGAISASRRAEYGPPWLVLPDWAAELPEELTLWQTLAALPVPLERDLDQASFQQLLRVLQALNERYGLLRSCGLDPEVWFDAEGLSINQLKELKALRKKATERWHETDGQRTVEWAYEQAFRGLMGTRKTLAGAASFTDFAFGEIGQEMLHGGPRSLSESLSETDDGLDLGDTIAAPDPDLGYTTPELGADQISNMAYVIEHCPSMRREPALAWFARAALIDERPIHGTDGILADTEFRRLVGVSGRYLGADDKTLLTAIESDLVHAFHDGLAPLDDA